MRTQTTSSETVEMYLKTIAELSEDGSAVIIARVAERLGRIVAALKVAAYLVHAVGVPEPECDVWAAALASCRHCSPKVIASGELALPCRPRL